MLTIVFVRYSHSAVFPHVKSALLCRSQFSEVYVEVLLAVEQRFLFLLMCMCKCVSALDQSGSSFSCKKCLVSSIDGQLTNQMKDEVCNITNSIKQN